MTLARPVLDRLVLRELTLDDAIQSRVARVEGDRGRLAELFDLFDDFGLMFPVVEPRRDPRAAPLDSAPRRP